MNQKQGTNMNHNKIEGPEWNIEELYSSIKAKEIWEDIDKIQSLFQETNEIIVSLKPQFALILKNPTGFSEDTLKKCKKTARKIVQIRILLNTINNYTEAVASVNSKDPNAMELGTKIASLYSKLEIVSEPLNQFITFAPNNFIEQYLKDDEELKESFQITKLRQLKDYLLEESEENIISSLKNPGLNSWDKLYNEITSKSKIPYLDSEIGFSKALGILKGGNEEERKSAFKGIEKVFTDNNYIYANILNSIASFRLELIEKKSKKKPMSFLTAPLHDACITEKTLNAMMSAIENSKETARKIIQLRARALGKTKCDPWDLICPAPLISEKEKQKKYSFDEAIDIVKKATNTVHTELTDFIDLMVKNKWIEGRDNEGSRAGAYCTTFFKNRTPRVYMTYQGSLSDVSTLAHELGHAFHSWQLKNEPIYSNYYPMTLAETASIFTENLVADELLKRADNTQERLRSLWEITDGFTAYILNIPMRFYFEHSLYEKRKNSYLGAEEITNLMIDASQKTYGNSISHADPVFWATKLHFYISDLSFYNFPYSFGYLFGQSVMKKKDELGSSFYPVYCNLLKETALYSAEDLIKKHFNEDIENPEFWNSSIDYLKPKLDQFESLIQDYF